MHRRLKLGLIGGFILLMGLTIYMVFHARESDPIVQGKPLSHWLAGYETGGTSFSRTKADEIVNEAGTNAIPTLLRMLRKRDSAFKIQLIQLLKHQRIFQTRLAPASQIHYRAGLGFAKLGPSASNAVPELVKIYDENISNSSRFWTINAIGSIGSQTTEAIPFLISALSNTNREVRLSCITSLQVLHANPELSVPALITALQDQQSMVKYYAIMALGAFGSDAKAAIPILSNLVHDPDRNVRQGASAALNRLQQSPPPKSGG